MSDLDFSKLAPHLGSQQNAFEEFCSQLAAKDRPAGSKFERFYGAGGDGGVEAIAKNPDGTVVGWQAKYVFEIDALLAQAAKSLATALSVHPTLTKYVVCFPFDLTGPTGRKGTRGRPAKGSSEKFEDWAAIAIADAKKAGRELTIEKWPAHELTALVVKHDASGGMRHYFFSSVTLTPTWFARHIDNAVAAAGPRYTAALSLETPLARWFSAFEGDASWHAALGDLLRTLQKRVQALGSNLKSARPDTAVPKWPDALKGAGNACAAQCDQFLLQMQSLAATPSDQGREDALKRADELHVALTDLVTRLRGEVEAKHGKGKADSKPFREFMAAYQMEFPTANLDVASEARQALAALVSWLNSPNGFLAFRRVFILSGSGGSGKTHGICDVAIKRLQKNGYTCVVFGHQFSGNPDPWTRLAESLGLPVALGKEGLLDALSAAAQASGRPLILCVDAVNETQPRNYWHSRLAAFAADVTSRPAIKLCVSCRTSFLDACLPATLAAVAIEHEGFAGMERAACNAFFQFYGLEAPLVPLLQPELANPLYLKLVCQTLKHKGLKQLPSGWHGLAPVIRAFIEAKEDQFAVDHGVSRGAGIVGGSLSAVATAIAASGNAALPWSQAQTAVEAKRPQAKGLQVIEWLIRADLLIEDGPFDPSLGGESVVRPAFERFGDFLIAAEMLAQPAPFDVATAFRKGGPLHMLCDSEVSVGENAGVLAALSVLIPESGSGVELHDLVAPRSVRTEVSEITIRALPWRTPGSFGASTIKLVRAALGSGRSWDTMDAVLAVTTQPSVIDAFWLDATLRALPLARRDAFWSSYLRENFERGYIVHGLIEAARDIDLAKIESGTAERWALVLLWFTAAADRRVKDLATRAVVAIFRAQPVVIHPLVERMLAVDDDEVRERVLLCAFGALILSRDTKVLKALAPALLGKYEDAPAHFQNALIRDHIRCLAELARHCGCLDGKANPLLPTTRNPSVSVPKPPTDAQVAAWEKLNRGSSLLEHSCLHDDFNHYSISCLRPWMKAMLKPAIGAWIFERAMTEFDYANSECSDYDEMIASGGGRSRPAKFERIGKKYQWLGLYQLASRLFDSVEAEKDSWVRVTGLPPLILQEERKMDPTLTCPVVPERSSSECWWIPEPVNLDNAKLLSDAVWVNAQDDVPSIAAFLGPVANGGRKWLTLVSYPSWSTRQKDAGYNTPYRWLWLHLKSFLVPKTMFEDARVALDGRNFFNEWMPTGAKWLHVFAGEYPWGSAFNTEADDWLGYGDTVRDSQSGLKFVPAENEVVAEWQYDGSLPDSIHMRVPARVFFKAGTLHWNGVDGFSTEANLTVFRDPAVSEGGPTSLIADFDDLRSRLDVLGYRLVWTMLGEKTIVSDPSPKSPRIIFSQMAYLNEDGTIGVGKRAFFTDYEKDTSLGPIPKKTKT